VLVLNDRIGERTGWFGTRRYTDDWDTNPNWWHIGYPQDLTSLSRPTSNGVSRWTAMTTRTTRTRTSNHQADVYPVSLAGRYFGFWDGDVGPRAVAVQSWQSSGRNGPAGAATWSISPSGPVPITRDWLTLHRSNPIHRGRV